jgi:SSS family solute:Na+ symporter
MIKLHFLEAFPIILYLILILYLGFRNRNKNKNLDDFILGSRLLTLPAFIATLVTTWYGGILGVGEFTYRFGLSNWIVFGLPYYIFAILFAFFLAPKIRSANLHSIPDQFYKNYGKTNGLIGTVFTFFMTMPAAYVLMLGLLIKIITDWPIWFCVVTGSLLSLLYVITGGFRAVVRTDKLQFVLMFGGFIILLLTLVTKYGGFDFLKNTLPGSHLTLHGGNSWQYILGWFLIASWTFIDPGFHQRSYAAKSSRTAKVGILWSVLFWLVFDFLTTSTGLYARALFQDIKPALSYPVLSHEILPPLFSGIFLTGLLATIMSTVDSLFHLSAVTIGYDFLKKFSPARSNPVRLVQYSLIITGIISIAIALLIPSIIQIWYIIGSLFIPPMLLPLCACYYPKIQPDQRFVTINLSFSFLISFTFLIISLMNSQSLNELNYFLNIQPIYPGMVTSILIFTIGLIKKRKISSSIRL